MMDTSQPVRSAVRRRPRDRRATIVRAASEAFARHGYHGTSMSDIAAAVGITSTALYRHFRSKQQLLGHCLLNGLDVTVARLDSAHRGDPSGEAVLTELVRVALELRGLPRLWQLEFRNLRPTDRMGVLARAVRLTRYVRIAIRARRPDLAAVDVELLSWCVLSVAVSPSYHRVELPESLFAEVLDKAVAATIDVRLPTGVAAQRRAARAAWVSGDVEFDRGVRPERLIVAAARLFNTRGYAAVSIEDIGAAVGVSGPALYHHFAGKSELLNQIIDRNDQWIRLYTSRAATEGNDPHQSLLLLLSYFARFAVEQPDLMGTTLSEVAHLPQDLAARYRQAHRDGIIRWARMLQTVRPELSLPIARVCIQAVTTVVIDAARNPRLSRRGDIVEALEAVGAAIAFSDAARS
ncbi:TetR/AcrR family transcriptional regulator [Nocardia sp. NPDC050630]|uniref:TetR/AcrR family transcriptional regulator n=1 Tax=Nocardia sp. NPDC050630 TaxID=3364321 RepID=UPI0037B6A761